MINLMATRNNEIIRAIIDCPEDLDVLEFLFPHGVVEIDTMGNELVAIVKEDHAV